MFTPQDILKMKLVAPIPKVASLSNYRHASSAMLNASDNIRIYTLNMRIKENSGKNVDNHIYHYARYPNSEQYKIFSGGRLVYWCMEMLNGDYEVKANEEFIIGTLTTRVGRVWHSVKNVIKRITQICFYWRAV